MPGDGQRQKIFVSSPLQRAFRKAAALAPGAAFANRWLKPAGGLRTVNGPDETGVVVNREPRRETPGLEKNGKSAITCPEVVLADRQRSIVAATENDSAMGQCCSKLYCVRRCDACVQKIQILELREAFEVRQPSIGDCLSPHIQMDQICEPFERCHAGIGYFASEQLQLSNLGGRPQVGEPGIVDRFFCPSPPAPLPQGERGEFAVDQWLNRRLESGGSGHLYAVSLAVGIFLPSTADIIYALAFGEAWRQFFRR